jgi:hypothetical protein
MNSTFGIKSSIALLVLGVAILATLPPSKSSTLTAYQTEIAASAIGAIAQSIKYEIV